MVCDLASSDALPSEHTVGFHQGFGSKLEQGLSENDDYKTAKSPAETQAVLIFFKVCETICALLAYVHIYACRPYLTQSTMASDRRNVNMDGAHDLKYST